LQSEHKRKEEGTELTQKDRVCVCVCVRERERKRERFFNKTVFVHSIIQQNTQLHIFIKQKPALYPHDRNGPYTHTLLY